MVAEVITMDGAIIMAGAIITVGETSLPGSDYFERSRLRLAAFYLSRAALAAWPHAKVSLDGSPLRYRLRRSQPNQFC
jgi:hypothetical protein